MGTSTRRLQDQVARRNGDQMMGGSRDVCGRSVKSVFQIQLTITLNMLWQVTQDFTATGSSKKINEQYSI